MFFEDQNIEDIEKPKQQTSSHTPITFEPVIPQMTPRVVRGDIRHDDEMLDCRFVHCKWVFCILL